MIYGIPRCVNDRFLNVTCSGDYQRSPDDLFNVVITTDGQSITLGFNDAKASFDAFDEDAVKAEFSNFDKDIDGAVAQIDFRGLPIVVEYPENSPTINLPLTYAMANLRLKVKMLSRWPYHFHILFASTQNHVNSYILAFPSTTREQKTSKVIASVLPWVIHSPPQRAGLLRRIFPTARLSRPAICYVAMSKSV